MSNTISSFLTSLISCLSISQVAYYLNFIKKSKQVSKNHYNDEKNIIKVKNVILTLPKDSLKSLTNRSIIERKVGLKQNFIKSNWYNNQHYSKYNATFCLLMQNKSLCLRRNFLKVLSYLFERQQAQNGNTIQIYMFIKTFVQICSILKLWEKRCFKNVLLRRNNV